MFCVSCKYIRVNYMYEYIWGDFKLFLMDDIVFYIYI